MNIQLHHLLENTASVKPEAEALVDGDRRLTYAEFHAGCNALAANLLRAGIDRRDRVAIWLDKSAEEAMGFFAISKAGGVSVPVNPLLKARQVTHILEDCQVRFVVTDAKRLEANREALARLDHVSHVLIVDDLETRDDTVTPRALDTNTADEVAPGSGIAEDLAAILYTSGSTGSPKGVMLSHGNLLAGSRIVCNYLEITEHDRILSVLPFSFDVGLNQLITAVEKGGALVLLRFRFGEEIVRAIKSERCTALAGVPTIWAILAGSAPTFRKEKLSSLRCFSNTGGPVPSATLAKIRESQPHVDFFLMYGLTEAFRSTYLPPDQADVRPTSIGKAIPECEIMVVGEDGSLCGPGEEGILVHRGPTVSLGYWNRPEETARVLRPNPLVGASEGADIVCFSGDRVRRDEEGYLYFVARDDAMIKSSGYRISPSEVEEVVTRTPGISQSAVIGLPDASIGERVHAICVAEDNSNVDATAVLENCAQELPRHMLPRSVEFLDELPRSPNGKVDYKALKLARKGDGQ